MYLSLQQKSSFGTYFFVYIHEVHSCFQKSHQHRKWNPRVSCTSSPKMSQKTTCDVKSASVTVCVIHAVTPFWPMYYIILSSSYSCLKKASMSSSSSWFWILTFDSKSYSALQWKLFGQICISVMLRRNWWIFDWVGNVWQNSHWEQRFSLYLSQCSTSSILPSRTSIG